MSEFFGPAILFPLLGFSNKCHTVTPILVPASHPRYYIICLLYHFSNFLFFHNAKATNNKEGGETR